MKGPKSHQFWIIVSCLEQHPGPVAWYVVEIMVTLSQEFLTFSHTYVGSSFCSPLFLPATPLFKVEVFPLINLISYLCKSQEPQEIPFPSSEQFNGFTTLFPCYSPCHISGTAQASLLMVLLAQKILLSLKLALLQALHDPAPRLAGQGNLPYVHRHPSKAVDLGDPNST